jgi:hydrogenase maturation protease HycI
MPQVQVRAEYPAVKSLRFKFGEISMSLDKPLFEQLSKLRDSSTLVLCIGNILKSDDGAGPLVCQQLKAAKVSAELIDAGTVPENYIQRIIKKAPQTLIIVDAVDFGAEAGTIEIFEPERLNSLVISTHTLSPRLFVDVIRRSIQLEVYFIGIQPEHTQLGQNVSDAVSRAIKKLSGVLAEVFTTII